MNGKHYFMIHRTFLSIRRLLFILPVLLSQVLHAQERVIMMRAERCDTAEVDQYIARSKQLAEVNDDSVAYYLGRAVQQSYHCNFNDRIIRSLTELAAWQFGHSVDQAIRYAHLAILEHQHRGNVLTKRGQIIYKAYNVLAKAYETKGVIDSSAFYYYLLNDVIEQGAITDPEYAVSVYSQLALFWLNSNWDINEGNIDATRFFIDKTKTAETRLKDSSVQAYTSYLLQGAYYFCTGNYDSSRYYYHTFLKERRRIGTANATWEAATYLNVAETYLAERKTGAAIQYIRQTLALKQKLAGNPRYLLLARLYLSKAWYLQKAYANSITAFETAFDNTARHEVLGKEVIEGYKIVAGAYEKLGMNDKALFYMNTYTAMHDSLMKKDKLDLMNRLQVKFRVAEKDRTLAEQKLIITEGENKARKKNFWIGGISMLTVFLIILFALWQRNNRHKQRLQQEAINNFQQKIEIASLNATINGAEKERARIARELHDGIGGLLAAAKMNFELVKTTCHLHNKVDYTDGLQLLSEAAAELRKTAHNMMPEILLQEGLVEAVGHFCRTVGRNSGTDIHFQTTGPVRVFNTHMELAIYRVVQELVHNILKHAAATEAIVQMGFGDEIFDLSIEDNGIGMPDNIRNGNGGMGFKSIEERLKVINGKMIIRNLPGGGTGIYLEISLPKENIAIL
jgi:two-component system, NarL family, sensor kinase